MLSEQLSVYAETNLEEISLTIETSKLELLIIDSIQTIFHPEVTSAPENVISELRECTAGLMRIAKTKGVAIFIVGHVTKEGRLPVLGF